MSNQVLLVERSRGDRFVLKQAREQLRVEQEWKCDVRRIWREMDVLRLCAAVVQQANISEGPGVRIRMPVVLFEDRDNYCYAMTAAPEGHQTWKAILLNGCPPHSHEFGRTVGMLLGALHAGTWKDEQIAKQFSDCSYFDDLRIDPYYRFTAHHRGDFKPHLEALVESLPKHRLCLVHGDFSPKNLLILDREILMDSQVMLIDYEVGHFGDPAFDIGFFLTHLVLKASRSRELLPCQLSLVSSFWCGYASLFEALPTERRPTRDEWSALQVRGIQHLAGCLAARVDGKSPVDYLNVDQQRKVRRLARYLFKAGMSSIGNVADPLREALFHDSYISGVFGREVLDSRGKPTVEAEVHADYTAAGLAIVPSGASTGRAEAVELRDGDPERYDGLGVRKAVAAIEGRCRNELKYFATTDQRSIDRKLLELDPSPQKSVLGGNSLLAVSLAAAHAGANASGQYLWQYLNTCFEREAADVGLDIEIPAPKLPLPMVNMISGGKHAGGNLDFQDILIQPVGTSDYPTQLEWIVRVYRRLSQLLIESGYEGYLVGDEGGFGPRLKSNREAVEFVVRAIEAAKLQPGSDVNIAIDVASSHFYRDGRYHLAAEQGKALTSSEMIDRLEQWVDDFPIASVEDGLAEDDWEGWQELTKRLGSRVKLVGDDLFATNEARVKRGIELGCGNSVLVKVNQIGTLTETFRTMLTAMSAGYSRVVSARSGETEDTTIADLAVGVGAESIKIGSIVRSERLAKYNRLLRIAEQLS